jgi:hypothetical protein
LLNAYSDVDWAGNLDDCHIMGGFAIFLSGNLIYWSSHKQYTISRSSTESEYKALADATAELIWIQVLLHELVISHLRPPSLWCDNIGATYLSANTIFYRWMKHVEVDYHFVHERVAAGQLEVQIISTKDQLVDVFIKPLPGLVFRDFTRNLNLVSLRSDWGEVLEIEGYIYS